MNFPYIGIACCWKSFDAVCVVFILRYKNVIIEADDIGVISFISNTKCVCMYGLYVYVKCYIEEDVCAVGYAISVCWYAIRVENDSNMEEKRLAGGGEVSFRTCGRHDDG